MSDDDTWHGGYYEAAMVLGKTDSAIADERLRSALTTLWDNAILRLSQPLSLGNLDKLGRIEGLLDHPSLGPLVCGAVVVRERETPNGDDWLSLVVPLGGLADRVEAVGGWPFDNDESSRVWREPLEQSLGEVALDVARRVPISLAVIGYEIAGIVPDFKIEAPRRVGFVTRGENGEFGYWPTTAWS